VIPRRKTPLELGLDWIRTNGGDDTHYALVSAMLGFSVDELKNSQL
jgi:hypothetical protein